MAEFPADHREETALVQASDPRQAIVVELLDGPRTPSELTGSTGLKFGSVSRALGELREAGLVELLVPEETQKGRLYGLAESGEAVAVWFASR